MSPRISNTHISELLIKFYNIYKTNYYDAKQINSIELYWILIQRLYYCEKTLSIKQFSIVWVCVDDYNSFYVGKKKKV